MTAYTDIRQALEEEVANIVGVPSASNRAWENVKFNPTTGTSWMRMTLLPGSARPAVVGNNPQLLYLGVFRIDLFLAEGSGPNAGDVLADAVRSAFSPGDAFTAGTTTVHVAWSERLPGRLDGPWYNVPVLIQWYTHRT